MRFLFAPAVVPPETVARLRGALESFSMLEELVRWGFASQPARPVLDVVVQDEFTHDVVLPWDDTLHLVFDTT
jgi:predicted ATPase